MIQNKISLLTASRRFEGYKNLVKQLESLIPELIEKYIVMVDDSDVLPLYRELKKEINKIIIMPVPYNWIYKNGFDTLYNDLMKAAKTEYCWMLFDCDEVQMDVDQFKEDFEQQPDIFGYPTHMERGDALETKYQLFKNDGLFSWFGVLHENQKFNIQPKAININSVKILHHNAVDHFSQNLKKTSDGFLILEKTEEGTDSDKRNLLYESLAWKIVNEGARHDYVGWFKRHYEINKEVIDWYHNRALEYYKD